MSLHYLGIAHFPVLHRQFSSPSSRLESSPGPNELTQDSKDVLVDRLNDLVLRLSKNNSLDDKTISTIHHEVDRIEFLVQGGERGQNPGTPHHASEDQKSSHEDDLFWGPATPTGSIKMHFPRGSFRGETQMTSTKAAEMAVAAEELASKLVITVTEIQTRKEESDHIHDLLITRAEKAAERILLLEYRVAEMEDDFEANQSELKFLRIQLQAIEAQCTQYIPRNQDPELAESIMNWKIDWEDIDKRSKARRKKTQPSINHVGDMQTTKSTEVTTES